MSRRTMKRRERKTPEDFHFFAYDLETSRIPDAPKYDQIDKPTHFDFPDPLYITVYGVDEYGNTIDLARPLNNSYQVLGEFIRDHLLQSSYFGYRYVAWNGNRFDGYFIARALLEIGGYVIRPYMTRSGALRGMRVIDASTFNTDNPLYWEFVDGLAMTVGNAPMTLKEFASKFAPEYAKRDDLLDFKQGGVFDPENANHCIYARADSLALFRALRHANAIVIGTFNVSLRPTIGATAIRIFQANIPENVRVEPLPDDIAHVVRRYIVRGGFCYLHQKYKGPTWKYDINQAYCAAMRDVDLPSGRCDKALAPTKCYFARVDILHTENKIPVYVRNVDGVAYFAYTSAYDVWLTSVEINQLESEGWTVTFHEIYSFTSVFRMREYVDTLENLRMNAPGGPKGAAGTMYKAIGNNSYGKTLELLDDSEQCISFNPPGADWQAVTDEHGQILPFLWQRHLQAAPVKPYHHPQIGAWICAHVRMQVRRAALLAPDDFVYADTDSVAFRVPVTDRLDVDSARYGAWKLEVDGDNYVFITKKVYASLDGKTRTAKGMPVQTLQVDDFLTWYEGNAPHVGTVQRNAFLTSLRTQKMFRTMRRRGSKS